MVDTVVSIAPAVLLLAYPVYLLLMAAVMAICGVSRKDISKWVLKQADRQRLTELIRAARRQGKRFDEGRRLSRRRAK